MIGLLVLRILAHFTADSFVICIHAAEIKSVQQYFAMNIRSAPILRELQYIELDEAAQVLGRGMCHNPVNVRAFNIGDDERRGRALSRFFVPVLRGLFKRGVLVGAFRDGSLVGVCGMAKPGVCQPSMREKLSIVPSLIGRNSPATVLRVLRWTGEWARRDVPEPHWHLGPVAVDPFLQGQGIGSAMLTAFCDRVDSCHALSYLETDKPENVSLYQKFGFVVVAQADVLSVRNWFMTRQPRATVKNEKETLPSQRHEYPAEPGPSHLLR